MRNKTIWIGEEINTSGFYGKVGIHSELQKRDGGTKLYLFKPRIADIELYISEPSAVNRLEELSNKEESWELFDYLYGLIVKKFGPYSLIKLAEFKMIATKSQGYSEGEQAAKREIRNALGIGI